MIDDYEINEDELNELNEWDMSLIYCIMNFSRSQILQLYEKSF